MLIVCDGMLRSGSALQYNLVCSLLEKMRPCVRHGRFDTEEEWLALPDLSDWLQDTVTYHVFKGPQKSEVKWQRARDGLVRILYIHRDIRDIAVAAKYKWGLTGDGLLEMLDRAVKSYETMENAGAFGAPWFLHQRYEDVFSNTRGAVWEIARFLEVTPTQEIVEEVVRECSVEAMVTVSRSKVLFVNWVMRSALGSMAVAIKRVLPPPLNGSWGLRKRMLRVFPKSESRTMIAYAHIEPTRGVPGAWRHQLDKHEQDVITARYKDYLIRAGYFL